MRHLKKLPRSFYLRSALAVARDIPGLYLCRRSGRKTLICRVVEAEAYMGNRDPASHAYRGETARNTVMFRRGGFLYVYFTYGMHFCANVVTGRQGVANAVLLRGAEPIEELALMAARRFGRGRYYTEPLRPAQIRNLTNGPAKLCSALAIGRKENGTDLCGTEIWLAQGPERTETVLRSARIGISAGTEYRWRFYLKGNRFVSPARPVRTSLGADR